MEPNPFLDPDFHIRWTQLTPERIKPAIEEAIARAQQGIDAIAAVDLKSAGFANTFMALEDATQELNVAWAKVTHLQAVMDAPPLREAHNAMLPAVSSFYARIPLNAELWQRLKAAAETPEVRALTGVKRRFVDETLADFRQAGADLSADRRTRLEAIQSELAQITQKYGENVLDATNAWQLVIEDEKRLAGIPAHAQAAARKSARDKGIGSEEKPAWRFTLHGPSQEPVMTYASDEPMRREMWQAATAVGSAPPFDNTEAVRRILALRAEKASLLSKGHFAELILERRMAQNADRALAFLDDLQARGRSGFARECSELEGFKAEQTGAPVGRLKAWEVGYWSEKLRQIRYDFDEEALRPYFPMDRVIAGLFELCGKVFGLRIVERPGVETWHPEVRYYDMTDAGDVHVGSFYADWHPRETKRGGAWMGFLVTGGPGPGTRAPHLGYICGNLTPPGEGKPALLTHREVQTIFHEFGHLLHHLLGEVEIKSLNGVNVAWDFVELPSQIMENWCWERESLDLFARHHETGAPIPQLLLDKMIAARNFRSACGLMRQIQFSKLDLILHTRTPWFLEGDLEDKIRAEVADCMIPTEPPARTITRRFNHIFSDPVGYAAGYYSYKWAEVLDADAFGRFKKEGIFNPRTGADFVKHILSRGNSADPKELYRNFMGRDPDLQALLVRSGLA